MLCVTDWRRNIEMGQYQIRIIESAEEEVHRFILHKARNLANIKEYDENFVRSNGT